MVDPLHSAVVVSTSVPCDAHVLIELAPGPWSRTHQQAGQYLMFRGPGDEKPRPMALASPPGAESALLLVRAEGERAAPLLSLESGSTVEVSAPAGPGFPVELAAGRPLIVVATGSALGPIRAAVVHALASSSPPASLAVIYGARTERQLAFAEELKAWADLHHDVRLVTSDGSPGRLAGRVQHHLPEQLPSNTLAFICGQPEMMDEVTALLGDRGVPAEQIFRNF